MTDAEIIKALEYCVNHKECADDCPCIIAEKPCVLNTPIKLLNLIQRQQAEIKKLESKNNTLTIDNAIMKSKIGSLEDDIQTAKSEAIKEFADALKSKSELVAPSVYAVPYRAVAVEDIDKFVKIAGGEENV
jgi:hypothetical protein